MVIHKSVLRVYGIHCMRTCNCCEERAYIHTVNNHRVCQKYTELGDDLCLYSKVSDMLSTYHYNLLTRRFIQSKFQHMTYEPVS